MVISAGHEFLWKGGCGEGTQANGDGQHSPSTGLGAASPCSLHCSLRVWASPDGAAHLCRSWMVETGHVEILPW